MGEAMVPALAHLTTHVVADIAGGAALTVTGESAMSAAGSGATLLQTKLRNLRTRFATRRLTWLTQLLHEHLLGDLPERGAGVVAQAGRPAGAGAEEPARGVCHAGGRTRQGAGAARRQNEAPPQHLIQAGLNNPSGSAPWRPAA